MIFRTPSPLALRYTRIAILGACAVIPLRSLTAAFAQSPSGSSAPTLQPAGQSLLLHAEQLAASSRLAEAEALLNKAQSLDPNDLAVLRLSARVKGRLGEYQQAVALFRTVVRLQPKVAENHLDLAFALADAHQLDAALAETSAALALEPRSPQAHLNRARILSDLHRNAEAAREFDISSRLAPDNPDIFFYWALLEREEGHLARETELRQRVVQLQPTNDRAFFFLGRSLSEQSRHPESIEALRRAIALNPHASDAVYMLAREIKPQNPEEARTLMQQFNQVRSQDAKLDTIKTLGNEAYAASQQQDWPRSIELLRKALSECGDCSIAAALHRNLGLSLCHDGSLNECAEELHTALRLNPDDRDAVAALNMIQR
jgi:tetratricopeptide (TPR) repeat protein